MAQAHEIMLILTLFLGIYTNININLLETILKALQYRQRLLFILRSEALLESQFDCTYHLMVRSKNIPQLSTAFRHW